MHSLLASGGVRTKHQIMRRTSLTLFGSSRGMSAKVTWKSKHRGKIFKYFSTLPQKRKSKIGGKIPLNVDNVKSKHEIRGHEAHR